jgi:DNA-binding MarR family transcriptional regulator
VRAAAVARRGIGPYLSAGASLGRVDGGAARSLNGAPARQKEAGIPTRTAIEKRIARYEGRLSPNRRRLLQATLENPDETFFLSSRALARRYRVDPATIVRTVQALGYERYTDFATDLREHFVSRLTPYRILKATTDEKRSLADHVRHSLERDLGNVNRLQSGLDPGRVVGFARRIHQARRILVVGSELAASLASFLAYALLPLGFDAESPVGTGATSSTRSGCSRGGTCWWRSASAAVSVSPWRQRSWRGAGGSPPWPSPTATPHPWPASATATSWPRPRARPSPAPTWLRWLS